MCLAIPGQVVELFAEQPNLAMIEVVGVRRKVDLGLLADDLPVEGDWVLIHVGFAMSKISEAAAIEQMNTLRMLGEQESAMQEIEGYGLDTLENGLADADATEVSPYGGSKSVAAKDLP